MLPFVSTKLPALLMDSDIGVCPEVPMTMLPAPSIVIGAELTPELAFSTTSSNGGCAGEGTTEVGAAGCGVTADEATPGAAAAGAAAAGEAAVGAAGCGVTASGANPGAAAAEVATAVTGVV